MKKKIILITSLILTTTAFANTKKIKSDPCPGMSAVWINTIITNKTDNEYILTVCTEDEYYNYNISYNRDYLTHLKNYSYKLPSASMNDKLLWYISSFEVTGDKHPSLLKLTITNNSNGLKNDYAGSFNKHGELNFVADPKGIMELNNVEILPETPFATPTGSDQFHGNTIINIYKNNI